MHTCTSASSKLRQNLPEIRWSSTRTVSFSETTVDHKIEVSLDMLHRICAFIIGFVGLSLSGATSFSPDSIMQHTTGNFREVSWSYSNESIADSALDFSWKNDAPVASIQVELSSMLPKTTFVAECELPTEQGHYKVRAYKFNSPKQCLDPIALISGDLSGMENVLVRVHDQCLTSEVFGSLRCDCKEQLTQSFEQIKIDPSGGVVIYLQQEGRGIGIANKIAAYGLQDKGADTVEANIQLGFPEELRQYTCVPDILRDLGIKSVRLLTNNPYKVEQLSALGVNITERISVQVASNPHNERYLRVKRDRMSHFLTEDVNVHHPIEQRATRPSTRGKIFGVSHRRDSKVTSSEKKCSTDRVGLAGGSGVPNTCFGENNNPEELLSRAKTSYALGKQTVLDAIAAVSAGKAVVVVDDANRENEGDLIIAAAKSTAAEIGFIVRHSSGVLCVSLEGDRLDALDLPPMVWDNQDPKQTAYSVSVDYKFGTTTGISAADRALTFQKLVDPTATAGDFQRPGHVFPLRYKPGGVLARAGHTEASLDLTRLAGLPVGGVLAEVVNEDGSMMRFPDLVLFAQKYGLVLTSVQDITAYCSEMQGGF